MSRKTRKLMWSVPLIAAVAVIGALALFLTLEPNEAAAQAEEIPGMPTNLRANALGPTSIELLWDPPTEGGVPDGYRIDYSDDGLVWYSLEPNHNSTVFTDDTGLAAIQTRHYRIFAFNSGGTSEVLAGRSATTTASEKAGPPTGLTLGVGAPVQTAVVLTWIAPNDPEGAPVEKYKIEVAKDGRRFSVLAERTAKQASCVDDDRDCTYTHTGLLESQQRWYRVTAINYPNGKDASPVGSIASDTPTHTTTVGIVPAAPRFLRAGLNPAGRMWLYWDEPVTVDNDDANLIPGAPITGYYIHGGVAAVDGSGDGYDSAKLHFVEATTGLALTDTILAKFDAPEGIDGIVGNDDYEPWMFQVMAANSVVKRNLDDGKYNDGNGMWATALEVNNSKPAETPEVTDDLLERPRLMATRVNNVNAGRTDITLSWTVQKAQATPPTAYRLERSEDRIDWELVIDSVTGLIPTHTDTGLTAGTTYYYRVFAKHNKNDLDTNVYTEASVPVAVQTAPAGKPDEPILVSALAASETQIDVAWTPPNDVANTTPPAAGADGSEPVGYGKIVGYEVEISEDGSTWTLLTTVAGKLDYEYTYDEKTKKTTSKKVTPADLDVEFFHKGLIQGQTKYYRITTLNNAPASSRRSVPSNVRNATTLASFASDTPGGMVVKAMSHTSLELLWNARADDITAAPIIGYKIESSPLNADDECMETWTVLQANTMSTTTSYTDMGLAPETGRCYRVFGINVVATSSGFVGFGDAYVTTYDADAQAITLAGDAVTTPEDLTAPTGVVVSTLANTQSVSVTWDITSIQNAEQIKVALFNSGVTALAAPLITINPVNDEGSATFNDVPDGTYYVTVASFRTGERHKLSPLQEVTVE